MMKKLIVFFLLTLLSVGSIAQEIAGTVQAQTAVSANGKAFLLAYFDKTANALKHSVAGLSAAQLQFKPAPERWSISQCLEHIVMTEKALFDFAKNGMEAAPNPEKRKEVKMTDEDIINGINDRSHKATASKELTGTGKYNKAEEALADLEQGRKTVLAYINSKNIEDLRNHISNSPFGPVDGFHSFLFLAGHTSRHTAQIEEVMADANFPKK
jgi:uncharacterized damage-inducible protein DinB